MPLVISKSSTTVHYREVVDEKQVTSVKAESEAVFQRAEVDGVEGLCLRFGEARELRRARCHWCAGKHAARVVEDRLVVVVE